MKEYTAAVRPETDSRTLEHLAPGEAGVITHVGTRRGPIRRRLIDMGLTPGTLVTVRKIAPFGDQSGAVSKSPKGMIIQDGAYVGLD